MARFMRHFRFRGRVLCITGYSSWDSPSTAPFFFFFLFLLCPLIMLRFHGFESEIPMCIFGYSLLPLKVRATIHKVHNNKKRLNPHLSLYEAIYCVAREKSKLVIHFRSTQRLTRSPISYIGGPNQLVLLDIKPKY